MILIYILASLLFLVSVAGVIVWIKALMEDSSAIWHYVFACANIVLNFAMSVFALSILMYYS